MTGVKTFGPGLSTILVRCEHDSQSTLVGRLVVEDLRVTAPATVWRDAGASSSPAWRLRAIAGFEAEADADWAGMVLLDEHDQPDHTTPFDPGPATAVRRRTRLRCGECGDDLPMRWEKAEQVAGLLADSHTTSVQMRTLRRMLALVSN